MSAETRLPSGHAPVQLQALHGRATAIRNYRLQQQATKNKHQFALTVPGDSGNQRQEPHLFSRDTEAKRFSRGFSCPAMRAITSCCRAAEKGSSSKIKRLVDELSLLIQPSTLIVVTPERCSKPHHEGAGREPRDAGEVRQTSQFRE